jgi:hypothetical protein
MRENDHDDHNDDDDNDDYAFDDGHGLCFSFVYGHFFFFLCVMQPELYLRTRNPLEKNSANAYRAYEMSRNLSFGDCESRMIVPPKLQVPAVINSQ